MKSAPMNLLRAGGLALAAVLLAGITAGCRGNVTSNPPLHVVPNMDFQPKITAQDSFHFEHWEDHRGMRTPPAGTFARGSLDDADLRIYMDGDAYVTTNPLERTQANIEAGRKWYEITCATCHGKSGRGGGKTDPRNPQAHGLVGRRWPVAIPSFIPDTEFVREHTAEVPSPHHRDYEDGRLYDVISNGKNTMPAYGHMMSPTRRWQIVHYLRALQLQAANN